MLLVPNRAINRGWPGSGVVSPIFYAPLRNSLVPDKATGSATPTFTRATTKTFVDFEGLVRTGISGEAVFEGARRVYNLLRKTEDFADASWTKAASVVVTANAVTAPDGTTTGTQMVIPALSSGVYQLNSFSVLPGEKFRLTLWLRADSAVQFNFGINGQFNTNNNLATTLNLTSAWQRFCYEFTAGGDDSGLYAIWGTAGFGTGVIGPINAERTVYAWRPQLERVTGQSNQNPSEYVSVGVLSAPYHGAGVDGVKYFSTKNGNTVSSNVVTEATGAAIGAGDYKADASGPYGYFAEGARTNLAIQAQTTDTSWTKDNVTSIAYGGTAPDGTATVNTLTENTSTSTHRIYEAITNASGATVTISVYLQAGTRRYVSIAMTQGGLSAGVTVDTQNWTKATQTVGAGTVASSNLVALPNGTYRVDVTGALTGQTNYLVVIAGQNSATPTDPAGDSYLGNSSTLKYWGFQAEAASFASSYIPTTSASVTRNADVLTYAASGNADATQGSFYAEVAPGQTNAVACGTNSGYMGYLRASNSKFSVWDGVTETSFGAAQTVPLTTPAKVATAWGGGTQRGACNGSAVTSGVFDGDLGFTTTLYVGNNGVPAADMFGTIRNVRIYGRALGDGTLQAMTTT